MRRDTEHMSLRGEKKSATGDALNFGVKKYIKRGWGELKKDKNKAINHTDCDLLTVSEGTLDTAFNIKQYCRKKLREQIPKHGIFTCLPVHPVTTYQTNIFGGKKQNKKPHCEVERGSGTLTAWTVHRGAGDQQDVFIFSVCWMLRTICRMNIISWWLATIHLGSITAVLRSHLVLLLQKCKTKVNHFLHSALFARKKIHVRSSESIRDGHSLHDTSLLSKNPGMMP